MTSHAVQNAVSKGYYEHGGQKFTFNKRVLKKSISESRMVSSAQAMGELLPHKNNKKTQDKKNNKKTQDNEPCFSVVLLKADTLQGLIYALQNSYDDDECPEPAVLVFASDTNPGGSTKSSNLGTQEEALCRTTTLRLAQLTLSYPIPTQGVAYIPHVQALVTPPNGGKAAPTFAAICGALRSCVSGPNPSGKETEFLVQKICGVLDQACVNGHTTLVLGAWGCGAFGNPVEWVAQTFRKCLSKERYQRYFRLIVFAVPNKGMLRVFEAGFGDAATSVKSWEL